MMICHLGDADATVPARFLVVDGGGECIPIGIGWRPANRSTEPRRDGWHWHPFRPRRNAGAKLWFAWLSIRTGNPGARHVAGGLVVVAETIGTAPDFTLSLESGSVSRDVPL